MKLPAGSEKIENISEYRARVSPLTHVAVFRSNIKLEYYHHYLVLEVGRDFVDIIHYAAGKDAMKALSVARVTVQRIHFNSGLLDFASGVFFIKKQNYPSSDAEKKLAYERIASRLGETEYSASSNNCESFVTWVLTGEAESVQFDQGSSEERCLADLIDSGLDQGTKVIHILETADLEMCLSNVSLALSNVCCFLGASAVIAIAGAKTVVSKVGSSAVAAVATSYITVVVAAPIEIIFCGKEIVAMYRQKQKTHLSTKLFIRQVTKKIGGSATSVVTATGSEFVGALIGQIVFPTPVLGGIIGGSIGGVIGSLSGRATGSIFSGKMFDSVAPSLERTKNKSILNAYLTLRSECHTNPTINSKELPITSREKIKDFSLKYGNI